MHMFAPERPKTIGGRQAILKDGHAMPVFTIVPEPDGKVRIFFALSRYDSGGGWGQDVIECHDESVPGLLKAYRSDPETFFFIHFGWVPQERTRAEVRQSSGAHSERQALANAKPSTVSTQAVLDELF